MSENSKRKIEWMKFVFIDIMVGIVAVILGGVAWYFCLIGFGIYFYVLTLLFTDLARNRNEKAIEEKDMVALKNELGELDKLVAELKQKKSNLIEFLVADDLDRECTEKIKEKGVKIDQYNEKTKLVKWKIGCACLGIVALCAVVVIQNFEAIRNVYIQLTNLRPYDGQNETEIFTEAGETDETESETYVPSVIAPGQVISYNTKCEMKLDIDELTGSLSDDELDELFLGLYYTDISDKSEDEIYELVQIRLSGLCDVQKEGELEDASMELQDEVLDISKKEADFLELIEKEKKNPSYLPGTETWYRFLPESETLIEIISKREEFMESCPDGHIAEGLFEDYYYMGEELKKQECDENVIKYFYGKAGLWCVRELKFKDDILWDYEIKHENTMRNLRIAYNALADYEKSLSGTLYKMVGRYMREKGWKVE